MRRVAATLSLALVLASWPPPATAQALPEGRGILLPIRDRVGDPAIASLVESSLEEALIGSVGSRVETEALRSVLRRMRIRDLEEAAPRQLEQLAQVLGNDWFLSSTLHEAIARPVPQVTVSAKIYRVGDTDLSWAGYESGSGLDERRWLGLGGTDDLEVLARQVTGRLLVSALGTGEPAKRPSDLGRRRRGYAARPLDIAGGRFAVVPLDSLSQNDPTAAGDQVTAALTAALSRRGASLVFPGLVGELQRREGLLLRGEIDPRTRQALLEQVGVERVITGLVEVYRPGSEQLPNPRVAFSLMLVDTADGRVAAVDGMDHRGADAEGLFRFGRIHSAGSLTWELTGALLDGFAEPSDKPRSRG